MVNIPAHTMWTVTLANFPFVNFFAHIFLLCNIIGAYLKLKFRNWSIPKNTNRKSYLHKCTFFHLPGRKICTNLCTFTQIMCNLHKSWSTRGHVDQPAKITNHIYTKSFSCSMIGPRGQTQGGEVIENKKAVPMVP